MPCHRLIFPNARIFEIVIEPAAIAGDGPLTACAGVIYRVIDDVREYQPLHREGGGPIQIFAPSEAAAVDIAEDVLSQVLGSKLESRSECGHRSRLPPLPRFAV